MRHPEAHLGYGVIVRREKLFALGDAAKAVALAIPPLVRTSFDPEYLAYSELLRVWNRPEMVPVEDFSVPALLDGLGRLHGVALFNVPAEDHESADYDNMDNAVVYRETLRKQGLGYSPNLLLPELPTYGFDRLTQFFALFGARYNDLVHTKPSWIFAVTQI